MKITKDDLIIACQDFINVYKGKQGPVDLSYYDETEWHEFGIDEMLVCTRGSNKVYLNIQGTDEKLEWHGHKSSNLNFFGKQKFPVKALGNNKKIKVHPGHLEAYLAGRKLMLRIAREYEFIYFHVHSRGAGISNIASRDIQWHIDNVWKKNQRVINITGGSPRSYNFAGADEYNKSDIICKRLVYRNDIVANVPWPIMGYKHIGDLIRLGKPYIPSPIGIPWDHEPIKYPSGMRKYKGEI